MAIILLSASTPTSLAENVEFANLRAFHQYSDVAGARQPSGSPNPLLRLAKSKNTVGTSENAVQLEIIEDEKNAAPMTVAKPANKEKKSTTSATTTAPVIAGSAPQPVSDELAKKIEQLLKDLKKVETLLKDKNIQKALQADNKSQTVLKDFENAVAGAILTPIETLNQKIDVVVAGITAFETKDEAAKDGVAVKITDLSAKIRKFQNGRKAENLKTNLMLLAAAYIAGLDALIGKRPDGNQEFAKLSESNMKVLTKLRELGEKRSIATLATELKTKIEVAAKDLVSVRNKDTNAALVALLQPIATHNRYVSDDTLLTGIASALGSIVNSTPTTAPAETIAYTVRSNTTVFQEQIKTIQKSINLIHDEFPETKFENAAKSISSLFQVESGLNTADKKKKEAEIASNKKRISSTQTAMTALSDLYALLKTFKADDRARIRVVWAKFGDIKSKKSSRTCNATAALRKACDGMGNCPDDVSGLTIANLCTKNPVPRAPLEQQMLSIHYHCLVGDTELWDQMIHTNGKGYDKNDHEPEVVGEHYRTFVYGSEWQLVCQAKNLP